MRKSIKILLSIMISISIILVGIITAMLLPNQTKGIEKIQESKETLKLEEKQLEIKKNLTFEINSELYLFSLISDSDISTVVSENELIDTSVLGLRDIAVKYLDNGIEKISTIRINIVDTAAPTILCKNELTTVQETDINLLQNVIIMDNSNEIIEATVEGNYDINTVGEYNLKYVAVDSSKNKAEQEFILKVIAKPVVNNTKPISNNNSTKPVVNNNKNNNNSNNSEPSTSVTIIQNNIPNNSNNENVNQNNVPNNSNNQNVNQNNVPDNSNNQNINKNDVPDNSNNQNINQDNVPDNSNKIESAPSVDLSNYRQQEAKKMISLINQVRVENGLCELKLNSSLESSAMIRAKEIISSFSHTRPNGTSCFTSISIKYRAVGENIAAGQSSIEEVFEAWMNSPTHRANILSDKFTDIGISLYYDEDSAYGYHWVQLFAGF